MEKGNQLGYSGGHKNNARQLLRVVALRPAIII